MNTRSQTKLQRELLEPKIDFYEASQEWRANKISRKNGCFIYSCCFTLENGDFCSRIPKNKSCYCSVHLKNAKNNL